MITEGLRVVVCGKVSCLKGRGMDTPGDRLASFNLPEINGGGRCGPPLRQQIGLAFMVAGG